MTTFIIILLILSIPFVWLFGTMFAGCMEKGWKRNITFILTGLIAGFLVTGCFWLRAKHDVNVWNNGACECGGIWELKTVTRYKNYNTCYYWECPECQCLIETFSNMR